MEIKKELTDLEQLTDLEHKIKKGQSLQMLSYIFKVKKQFIIKFAKLKNLILRKEYEIDYIHDLTRDQNKHYINGLLKR